MKASDTGFIQGTLQGLIPFNKVHQETLEKCIKILQDDFETPNTQLRFNKQKDAFTEIIKLVSKWEDSGEYPYRPCEEIIEVWERISGEYFEGI